MMVLCGAVVFFALFLTHAGITFFTLHEMEFINVLTHGGREFGRYPYSVYGEGVLKFLTYAIPLAFVQYRPLLYLLGRDERLISAVSPLFSLLFLIPAYILFRYGLRRYKSTGS
jgi:ABC-2 type transport system permease protein